MRIQNNGKETFLSCLNRFKCVLHLLICSHQNNTRFHKKTFILVQNENHGHNLTTGYARERQSGQQVNFVQYGAPTHYHLLSVHHNIQNNMVPNSLLGRDSLTLCTLIFFVRLC